MTLSCGSPFVQLVKIFFFRLIAILSLTASVAELSTSIPLLSKDFLISQLVAESSLDASCT